MPNKNERKLIDVALSRATTLNGLFLIGKFRPSIPDSTIDKRPFTKRGQKPCIYPNDEINRLRSVATLELKFSLLLQVLNECIQTLSHNVQHLKAHITLIQKDTLQATSFYYKRL